MRNGLLNYFLTRNFPLHSCCYNFLFCSDLLREKEVMGKTVRKYLNEMKVVFNAQKKDRGKAWHLCQIAGKR